MQTCFTEFQCCRERLADVEEIVAERSSEVHRQLQRVFSPLQVHPQRSHNICNECTAAGHRLTLPSELVRFSAPLWCPLNLTQQGWQQQLAVTATHCLAPLQECQHCCIIVTYLGCADMLINCASHQCLSPACSCQESALQLVPCGKQLACNACNGPAATRVRCVCRSCSISSSAPATLPTR